MSTDAVPVNDCLTLLPLREYEQKRAVLHGVGCYAEAIDAYKTTLVTLGESHPRTHIFERLEPRVPTSPCRPSLPALQSVKNGGGIRRLIKHWDIAHQHV